MKAVLATLVALALLASTEPARCQENAKAAGERSWYGDQILLADGLVYAVLGGASSNDHGGAVAIASLGLYLAASPVIHGLHHQYKKMVVSIAMRLIVPLVGFGLGEGMANCPPGSEDRQYCKTINGFVGAGIGAIVVTVVDSVFARTSSAATQPVPPPPPKAQPMVSLSSVGVVPTSNGASLMLSGQF